MKYPDECPAFQIISNCPGCHGRHTTGAPSQYNSGEIDVWSCVVYFEPFEPHQLKPLTPAAEEMIKIAYAGGVKYPGKKGRLPI